MNVRLIKYQTVTEKWNKTSYINLRYKPNPMALGEDFPGGLAKNEYAWLLLSNDLPDTGMYHPWSDPRFQGIQFQELNAGHNFYLIKHT
jgi:hypothetical protein